MSTETANTPKTMPAFRICRRVRYANVPEGVVEPAYYGGDVWFEQFRDQYWLNREEAEKWLEDAKVKWAGAAAKGAAVIVSTDKELAERIWHRACTQEDCRLPYYCDVQNAAYAVEYNKWGQELFVGEYGETNDICRLNTLLSDKGGAGQEKRDELDQKMRFFGECEISWSCSGHTRAEWQTQADAEWLIANHPDWEVDIDGSRLFVRDAAHAKVKCD